MASSIINCSVSKNKINTYVNKILNEKFNTKSRNQLRIYGNGKAADKISKMLLSFNFRKFKKKKFYDILN